MKELVILGQEMVGDNVEEHTCGNPHPDCEDPISSSSLCCAIDEDADDDTDRCGVGEDQAVEQRA